MTSMNVNLHSRKNFKTANISLNTGLNVLIGNNGSGKSSLMESLFSTYINDSDKSIVGFTSGQNENFTELFGPHLQKVRKLLNSGKVSPTKTLFFDRKWSSLLILLATFFKRAPRDADGFAATGMCSQYLLNKNYKIRNFSFSLEVPKKFFELYSVDDFQTSYFAQFIEQLTGVDANTVGPLKAKVFSVADMATDSQADTNQDGVITSQIILGLSRLLDSISGDFTDRIKQIHHFIYFFQIASIANSYLNLDENNLEFDVQSKAVGFGHISDGEYQLLSVYAIVDLFGDQFDFILLDEVDSHVHTSAVPDLWTTLSKVKDSVVVTSTHSPVSLKYINTNRILSLRDGSVREGILKLSDLQQIFDSKHSSENVLALCFRFSKQIILIDGLKDWEILIALFKRKLGVRFQSGLLNYSVHELPSSRNNIHEDKDSKDKFVESLRRIYQNDLDLEDQGKIELLSLISLKDRDNMPLQGAYSTNDTFNVVKKISTPLPLSQRAPLKTMEIYLHRREIENYLLTKSLVQSAEPRKIIGNDSNGAPQTREQVLESFDNEEYVSTLDVKKFISEKICVNDSTSPNQGFSIELLNQYVDTIPQEEISDYLEPLHKFLCSQIGIRE